MEERDEDEVGVRLGWSATKAMKGYVVAWSFSEAEGGVSD